ncbi:MAG: VOC family protein, partial [Pseudomonadota bacterium]
VTMTNAIPEAAFRPIKLAHVVMRTSPGHYEGMIEFYRQLLGATIVHQAPIISFLTYDDEHHRVAISKFPLTFPKLKFLRGVDHVAFTFSKLEGLLEAYKRMQAYGIKPVWSVHHGGTISIYYEDVDGNLVETQVDVFDTIEKANAYIASESFVENPIGVDFDPDEWIARLAAGEPEEEVSRRIDSGPRKPSTVPREIQGTLLWLLSKIAPPPPAPAK